MAMASRKAMVRHGGIKSLQKPLGCGGTICLIKAILYLYKESPLVTFNLSLWTKLISENKLAETLILATFF
jgi:hypothetical protein